MCTVHVPMRFCHRVDRSFDCKAKEGRHVRIYNKYYIIMTNCLPYLSDIPDMLTSFILILGPLVTGIFFSLSSILDMTI